MQLNNKPGEDVRFIKRVYDGKFHFGEHEDFYFMQKYDPKDPADLEYY